MRLITIECNDRDSFKYSVLPFLYYHNMKKNHARVSQLNNNLTLIYLLNSIKMLI